MTSFIKSAKHIHDVEVDLSYIEIVYERYVPGKGYDTYTDYINGEPLGDWFVINSEKQSISYEKFLDAMVTKTLEVRQRMAELTFEDILAYEQPLRVYVRIANAMKILDPTFQPPRINMESAWQVECIKSVCTPEAISECTNKSRLEYFFNVLCTIEREQ
jgi:hypothetical protein